MNSTRREMLTAVLAAGAMPAAMQSTPIKFVRFRRGSTTAYGILDGETVREIRGSFLGAYKETGARHKLAEVKLLYPCEPSRCWRSP